MMHKGGTCETELLGKLHCFVHSRCNLLFHHKLAIIDINNCSKALEFNK